MHARERVRITVPLASPMRRFGKTGLADGAHGGDHVQHIFNGIAAFAQNQVQVSAF
jgi:hypothetical protein